MKSTPAHRAGEEAYSRRSEEVREVIHQLTENSAWDHIQARDIDPVILDHVAERLHSGATPGDICKELGLNRHGGKNSKQWKKIQAYFRQGFRADAEAYLFQQTHKFYKTIERARETLEDAFENGTPHVVEDKDGNYTVIRVKGATKELGSFLDNYSKAISHPVKLWKEFGAIGEKPGLPGGGQGGVTIVVQNKIPMPSVEEIQKHQDDMKARAKAIEVQHVPVEEAQDGEQS